MLKLRTANLDSSQSEGKTGMNRQRLIQQPPVAHDNATSIIGPGMTVVGACKTEGTIRIEGRVEGNVESGTAIVIGEDAVVIGDVIAEDAVVAGRIQGRLRIASRVELQASSDVEGEIDSRRMALEEGATVNATVKLGSRGSEPSSLA